MKQNIFKRLTQAGVALVGVGWLVLLILQTQRVSAGDKAAVTTTTTSSTEKAGKGGSQLWSENCARCHNMRSPSSYSDAEWDVVMHHMRVRAKLTPEEHKKILEFLKSAN